MDEHGFEGGITIVKDYIFAARQRQRETQVQQSAFDRGSERPKPDFRAAHS